MIKKHLMQSLIQGIILDPYMKFIITFFKKNKAANATSSL